MRRIIVICMLVFLMSGCQLLDDLLGNKKSKPSAEVVVPEPPVLPPSDGYASISWLPPTENTDGSVLTDLAGYEIHYGTSSGGYTNTIPVGLGLTEYVVEPLIPGFTYYFAIISITDSGVKSVYSEEGSKVL